MLKIAHRGHSSLYGDNNMLSFQKAYEDGFDVIEMDIQLTANKEIVVFHDLFVDDILIRNMVTQDVAKHGVLLLKEVFEEFRYANVILYLDLKGSVEVAKQLVFLLQSIKYPLDKIWVASLNKNHLYVLMCSPIKVTMGFITANSFYDCEYEQLLQDIDFIVCDISILNTSVVKNMKDLKKGIFVYTANTKQHIQYIKKFDVDGIISNILF